MNVIGVCPIAWQSPMLALITSVKGFLAPWNKLWHHNNTQMSESGQQIF
jgi:hypothetical protein